MIKEQASRLTPWVVDIALLWGVNEIFCVEKNTISVDIPAVHIVCSGRASFKDTKQVGFSPWPKALCAINLVVRNAKVNPKKRIALGTKL